MILCIESLIELVITLLQEELGENVMNIAFPEVEPTGR